MFWLDDLFRLFACRCDLRGGNISWYSREYGGKSATTKDNNSHDPTWIHNAHTWQAKTESGDKLCILCALCTGEATRLHSAPFQT